MAAAAAAAASPMLLIAEATVESCLLPSVALHLSAQAFLATHAELATVPPYSAIVSPCPSQPGSSDATLFKAAQLGEALGVKVVAVRPANESRGLPSVPACILLSDAATGLPSALVQATHLTALRTAAGSAAATDALARKDASVLACFGAGMQASEHIKAVCAVRPIRTVHIINRSAGRAESLVASLSAQLPTVSFHVHATSDAATAASLPDVLRSAHVICTTTNSNEPLLRLADVSPGTHINAVGSYLPHMHELESSLVARCRIAIDTEASVAAHAGDLHTPLQAGLIRKEDLIYIGAVLPWSRFATPMQHEGVSVGFELGEQKKPSVQLRQSESDITLFKSVGSAIQDVCTAYGAVQVCRATQHGKSVEW